MNFRNAAYTVTGNIKCEIEHPIHGWVPFTCDPTDAGAEFDTLALFQEMQASGEVVPYSPPTIEVQRDAFPALSPRQLRLALIGAGVSLASVDAAIAAIPDQTQREAAQVEWEYATAYVRTHPLIVSLTPTLGLTDEQVDDLWQAAGAL